MHFGEKKAEARILLSLWRFWGCLIRFIFNRSTDSCHRQRVKEEQDPPIKKLLLELFQMSSTEDSPRPPLKAGDELKNMLKQEQLSASIAAEKVHKLLLTWFCDVFEESPVLNKVYLSDERPGPYQGEPNCAPPSIRARVNDASQRFPNAASVIDGIRGLVGGVAAKESTNEEGFFWQRATDGIVGKLRKTAKLSGSQPSLLDKTMKLGVTRKADSDRLEENNNFVDLCESDSSDGSNDNCDQADAEAEQIRKRKRFDNDLDKRLEDSQMGRKRRPWSDEEKLAVKEGYYEKGNDWAGIKRLYYSTLKFRSNVDIKVKKESVSIVMVDCLAPTSLTYPLYSLLSQQRIVTEP